MANRTVVFSDVSPDEMDRLRVGIAVKYPDAPPLGDMGRPIGVGYGYALTWVYDGGRHTLTLGLTGGVVFMARALRKVVGLVQDIIGIKYCS